MGEGGLRRRTMYFSTVDLGYSMPILRNSPTMCGAPQSGLADDIRRMRSRTCLGIVGRPGLPALDNFLQCSLNFLSRQAMTVSG